MNLWIALVPTTWLLICTATAGYMKVFSADPKIGFLAHAHKFSDAAASGQVLAPAKSIEQMQRVVGNDYVDATLGAIFLVVMLSVLVLGLRAALKASKLGGPSSQETPYVALPAGT